MEVRAQSPRFYRLEVDSTHEERLLFGKAAKGLAIPSKGVLCPLASGLEVQSSLKRLSDDRAQGRVVGGGDLQDRFKRGGGQRQGDAFFGARLRFMVE